MIGLRRQFFLVAATCSLFYQHAALLAQSEPMPAAPLRVPFTLLPSRHILVEVRINGSGPYRLIFDTGAPINLLSSRAAKEVGLKASGFRILTGPKPITVKSLTVGSVEANDVPILIMDHPTVAAISQAFRKEAGNIEGIVGFPFFARFTTTVDYQQQELLFRPNSYVPGDYLDDLLSRINRLAEETQKPRVVAPAGLWGFQVAKPRNDRKPGVNVVAVSPGGPAERGGLQQGDRLLILDHRWTDTVTDTFDAASEIPPGKTIEAVVERQGKTHRLKIQPVVGF